MSSDTAPINLTHHFLIAMPGLNDELFGKSVVYLCEHSARGALGLIINKPSDNGLGELFERLDLPLRREDLRHAPLLRGGPIQTERGFVLHEAMGEAQAVGSDETPPAIREAIREALASLERAASPSPSAEPATDEADTEAPDDEPVVHSAYASSLRIEGGLEMTTSRDVLEALSSGAGPRKVMVALGYSSWGEGQLESELAENSWLTVAADPAVIFDTPVEQRYEKAMALLGLEPWMLAPGSGRA
ncbi:YqgE/AlgH family protein [Malikia sp.]|uniref:YqgE/AlgH family protein n=1 Tax=Malikia sp. TaxID=2070706 RepID=UPI002623D492|nr:YqgE/AlgH family protein [Malikia sp.]MDD2728230.1 YqgE/AlgH family protein [Malikia sp.]